MYTLGRISLRVGPEGPRRRWKQIPSLEARSYTVAEFNYTRGIMHPNCAAQSNAVTPNCVLLPFSSAHVPHPLKSVLRSRRCRTPRHTPRIPAPLLEPLTGTHIQLSVQLRRRFLAMYEIAEPAADTALAAIEAAAGFTEVGDGGQFTVNGATGVPARV